MASERSVWLVALALLGTCGCFAPRGYLVTYSTRPYAMPDDEGSSRCGLKSCKVDITQLKEPVTQARLSVIWTDRAVAEAMKKAGMTEIRYADLQTFSLLNSVYERRRLIFYGE